LVVESSGGSRSSLLIGQQKTLLLLSLTHLLSVDAISGEPVNFIFFFVTKAGGRLKNKFLLLVSKFSFSTVFSVLS